MLAPFGMRPKGTVQVRMLPLAQSLVRSGWRATIVAPPLHNPEDAGRSEVLGGVRILHTPLPRAGAGTLGVPALTAFLLQMALSLRPTLLHLFKPKGHAGLAALLARFLHPRIPLVVDCDDWEGWGGWNDLAPYPLPAKYLFAWQEYDLPQRAAAVTVASRALETLVWSMGIARDRVFYLPNGIALPTEAHTSRTEARRALGLGAEPLLLLYTRFWEFPVAEVVQALIVVRQSCPAARLLVVGRGERGEEHELLRLAARAGLEAAIDYRGWVEPPTIPLYLAAADLALYPITDTLVNRAKCPVKLLELMAAGLPVVAGQVGQVAEYLRHKSSGLLVPPGDAAAMAQAALCLLHDAQFRQSLGEQARQRATQQFNWDALAPAANTAYACALQYK